MTEATDAAMSCFVYTADHFWGSTAADVLHVIEHCILHATHVTSITISNSLAAATWQHDSLYMSGNQFCFHTADAALSA